MNGRRSRIRRKNSQLRQSKTAEDDEIKVDLDFEPSINFIQSYAGSSSTSISTEYETLYDLQDVEYRLPAMHRCSSAQTSLSSQLPDEEEGATPCDSDADSEFGEYGLTLPAIKAIARAESPSPLSSPKVQKAPPRTLKLPASRVQRTKPPRPPTNKQAFELPRATFYSGDDVSLSRSLDSRSSVVSKTSTSSENVGDMRREYTLTPRAKTSNGTVAKRPVYSFSDRPSTSYADNNLSLAVGYGVVLSSLYVLSNKLNLL